jgi:hypothetical protein
MIIEITILSINDKEVNNLISNGNKILSIIGL